MRMNILVATVLMLMAVTDLKGQRINQSQPTLIQICKVPDIDFKPMEFECEDFQGEHGMCQDFSFPYNMSAQQKVYCRKPTMHCYVYPKTNCKGTSVYHPVESQPKTLHGHKSYRCFN
jgi:hypothetical protein